MSAMRPLALPLSLALLGFFAATCSQPPDRSSELGSCQLISKSGDELARCLVMKYSWRAESAGPAKMAWQWHLDSIRLEHEKEVLAVLAEQEEAERRATTARHAQQHAQQIQRGREWAECMWAHADTTGHPFEPDSLRRAWAPCLPKRPTIDELDAYLATRRLDESAKDWLRAAHYVSRDW